MFPVFFIDLSIHPLQPEEPCDHEHIGLRGFDFNIYDEDEEVVVREECSGPYLKMLIKLWPGDLIDQLKRMN